MKRWGLTFPLDGVPLSAHRELLREAETLGYTDAWTMEVDGLDSFTPAALAATWTDEMRIGTAIANVFTRGPALLAQSAAAVAEVAGGRFCLGIGASSPAIVENWNGVPLQRPYTRMRETVAFLKSVFAGEKAQSEYLGVRGFRIGRRFAEPPPIFIAALQERMLRLAGSEVDEVIINWLTADDVPKVVAVAKDAARAAGRDADALEVVCRIMVLPTENEEVARFVQIADLNEVADEPERAHGEDALLAPESVIREGRRVAAQQAAYAQLLSDACHRGADARVVRGQEADNGHHEERGVRVVAAVVLDERLELFIPAVGQHVGVDLVADRAPTVDIHRLL